MQKTESIPATNDEVVPEQPQEVSGVPLWVKGFVAVGVILFAVQLPTFIGSLSDAIQKSRAAKAYERGEYTQAIDRYKDLRGRYPNDNGIVERLGLSYYHAGRYADAIKAFDRLAGMKMARRDAEEINAAISDMAVKLNVQAR